MRNHEIQLKMLAALTDIAESLAVMSGRKKPYEPTFLDTFGFGDTDPQRSAADNSVQVSGGQTHGDPS